MESNSEASCVSDPNFAVICAFLERFASSCGITYPPFMDLQEMLENVQEVPQELIDLHIMLLRKARKSVIREKWEKALIKFCQTYSVQDGWEIERFGYKNSRLEVKLRALKCLLEGQFDLNNKFKTSINSLESTELRSKPIGKDQSGRIYWLQIDPISHIRVYREDLDEESWTLVAKDRESLVQLLQELSGEDESLGVNLLNGDNTPSENIDIEKNVTDTGQSRTQMNSDTVNVNESVNNIVIPQTDMKQDTLNIKESDAVTIQVKNEEEIEKDSGSTEKKRINSENEEDERDLKKLKLNDDTTGESQVGEAIEEPLVHIYGEGNGAECDAGNPDKEDNKAEEGTQTNLGEQSEAITSSQSNVEVKPQPKLWTIDTICGTGNFNHSGEASGSKTILFKSNQKNFSSFSIESVLEKKSADAESSHDQADDSKKIPMNNIRNETPIPNDDGHVDIIIKSKETESNPEASLPVPQSNTVKYFNAEINSVPTENSDEIVELNARAETCREDRLNVKSDLKGENCFPASDLGHDQTLGNNMSYECGDTAMLEEETNGKRTPKFETKPDDTVAAPPSESIHSDGILLMSEEMKEELREGQCVVKDEVTVENKKATTIEEIGSESGHVCSEISGNKIASPASFVQTELEVTKDPSQGGLKEKAQNVTIGVVAAEPDLTETGEDLVKPNLVTVEESQSANVVVGRSDSNSDDAAEAVRTANESIAPEVEPEVHEIKQENNVESVTESEGTYKYDKEKELAGNKETLGEDPVTIVEEESLRSEDARNEEKKESPKSVKCVKEAKKEPDDEIKAEKEEPSLSFDPEKEMGDEQSSSDEIKKEKVQGPSESAMHRFEGIQEEQTLSTEFKKEEEVEPIKLEEPDKDKEKDETEVSSIVDKEDTEECKVAAVPVTANVVQRSSVSEAKDANINDQVITPSEPKEAVRSSTNVVLNDEETDEKVATIMNEKTEEKVLEPEKEISRVTSDVPRQDIVTKPEIQSEEQNVKSCKLELKEDLPLQSSLSEATTKESNVMREHIVEKPGGIGEDEPPPSKSEKALECAAKEVEVIVESKEEPNKCNITEAMKEEKSAEAEVLLSKEGASEETVELKQSEEREAEVEAEGVEKEVRVAKPGRRRRKRKFFGQRTCLRNRKQNADGGDEAAQTTVPTLRTTRSRKSTEDREETEKSATEKRRGKRKSQDAVGSSEVRCEEKGAPRVVEDSQVDGVSWKKPQKRRGSAVNSLSDENSGVIQEESSEVGGKKMRVRGKRSLDSRIRKSIEEKRNQEHNEASTDEDGKAREQVAEATTKEGNEEGNKKKKGQKAKPKDGTPRQRQLIPEREIKLLGLSNMEELPTVRQSRRIAQMKLKEEAERNRIKKLQEAQEEEEKLKKKKGRSKGGKVPGSTKKKKKADSEEYEEEEEDGSEEKEEVKEKKRRRKKKDKLKFNELNPWISSSGSSSADEEEEELEDEEEEILFKSDHEFSPESEVEDSDYKPVKRARTAKVDPKEATGEATKYDDTACEKCGKKDHPEWILLCDKCDKGWHASCVRPALMVVPEGDWFCPPCEHTSLIEKLRESLVAYDRCKKQRENEELRRKRLAFVGISLANVIPSKKDKKPKESDGHEKEEGRSEDSGSSGSGDSSSESGSSDSDTSSSEESDEPVYQLRQRRTNVRSYRYNEYDELIKSALQEEMDAVKSVGQARSRMYRECVDEVEGDGGESEEGDNTIPNNTVSVGEENTPPDGQESKDGAPGEGVVPAKKTKRKKRNEDDDYEAETDAEEDDVDKEYDEAEEDADELPDRVPPVVPVYDKKKKKKSRSLNVKSLDFTSDEEEEDNSDSDFKGGSSDEESDFSLPSESESSEGVGRRKGYGAPLRRSTRARTARYDKEFIDDDSEDDTPRRKKSRNVWVSSESSDSDRSWGRRKKKNNRSGYRSTVPKKSPKSKRKKNKKRIVDSENEDGVTPSPKKPRNPKIRYGGIDPAEEILTTRRTRGKKINYREMNASDSDDEVVKRKPRAIGDSDEEFVAEKEKSEDSEEVDEDAKDDSNGRVTIRKESILRRLKKRRKTVTEVEERSDDEDDDEWLEEFADELEDLDEGEEDLLEEMLSDSNVPVGHLRTALERLRERREEKSSTAESEYSKPYPPIPDHMENPGLVPKFPKIEKINRLPQISTPTPPPREVVVATVRQDPLVIGNGNDGDSPHLTANPTTDTGGNVLLLDDPKPSPKEMIPLVRPPPYPFPTDPNASNSLAHPFSLNERAPLPPYNTFHGVMDPRGRPPPEYPHASVPTTVLGLEHDSASDARKLVRKPGAKSKREGEEASPLSESCEENSGDGRLSVPDASVDSPPKRRGRGRGKKQLLAEAQAKKELGISTVQAPTQFPVRGVAPESGSVITRILNAPQGPQPFAGFPVAGRPRPPFRAPFPSAPRPAAPPSSPSRVRTPSLFPTAHSLDPPVANLNQPKSSPLPAGFPRGAGVLPRYPSDPGIRPPSFPPARSSPNQNESYPYANFYPPAPYPPVPNGEETPPQFHTFPNHSFEEQQQQPPPPTAGAQSAGTATGTQASHQGGEEETSGEFGGLASYFASQREDDLDT